MELKEKQKKALDRLKGITAQHGIGEIDDQIVMSDALMELFDCDRLMPKEDAEELLKGPSYPPYRYYGSMKFLDVTIEFCNGTALKLPV